MKKQVWVLFFAAFAFLLAGGGTVWSADPIYIGVSGPLTGNYAEYGQNWKKAMDLGLGWINGAGGVNSRPIELIYTDSKSDPKESAAVAQKYVSDKRIVATIGDFTSTACMAAQPIYDQAGLVQLSPTASHPNFAPGSVWSFGIIGTQAGEGPFMARYAVQMLGKKKLAVLYINNDWGIATKDYFVPSMYNEMALIAKQREKLGWMDVLLMGPGSLYSPKLLEIGGTSVNGLYTSAVFFPKDPRPEVQKFVTGFEEKYKSSPNMFAAIAYDGINLMADVIRKAGTNRKAIRDELAKTQNFPGVTGKITFTGQRDVIKDYRHLIIKNLEFTLYAGK